MDCDMFLKMLDDYDNLDSLEKEKLHNHAKECENCRRELQFLESVIATTKTLPKLEVGADFLEDLNQRIDKEEVNIKKNTRHFKRNWQKYSAVAASLALVAIIGANSDMLVDRMDNDDSGVINEVVATAKPNAGAEATPLPEIEKHITPDTVKSDKTDRTQKTETEPETVKSTANTVPALSQHNQRNVTATVAPRNTEPKPSSTPTTKPAITEQPHTSEPVATEQPQPDNGYSLTTDAPVNQYALGEDYSISSNGAVYEIGIMTINAKQYDRAMGILIECINGSVGDCYNINASDLGTLEARLTNAGVEFDSYMPEHDGVITFKIVKY